MSAANFEKDLNFVVFSKITLIFLLLSQYAKNKLSFGLILYGNRKAKLIDFEFIRRFLVFELCKFSYQNAEITLK
jgi:hypothetical protein